MRALVDLAVHYKGKPVLLSDIARRQSLSKRYLERLFTQLRDGGVIRSVRGAAGGYILSREPEDITIFEVLELLEGPLGPVGCIIDHKLCDQTDQCVTHDLWVKLSYQVKDLLDGVNLEELRKKELEMAKEKTPMYYI